MGVLSRTGVRNDVRNSEFYEKPHVMRNRQKSERHRRRFQEMVSEMPEAAMRTEAFGTEERAGRRIELGWC
jgi:hypothetical protein